MKKFLVITLVTVLCVSCSHSTRDKVVGHWVDHMYNEYVFNEDGTGQQGNTAILGLSDMTWEMKGDTILLKKEKDVLNLYSTRDLHLPTGIQVYTMFLREQSRIRLTDIRQ